MQPTSNLAASSDTQALLSIVALLTVVGVALLMLAAWVFRNTRPDRELLAPLEVMGTSRWREGDPVWQRRLLDELRPDGAQPLSRARPVPEPDAAFDAGPAAPGFDDLVIPPVAERDVQAGSRPRVRAIGPTPGAAAGGALVGGWEADDVDELGPEAGDLDPADPDAIDPLGGDPADWPAPVDDHTPPSTELPVITPGMARPDADLAELGARDESGRIERPVKIRAELQPELPLEMPDERSVEPGIG